MKQIEDDNRVPALERGLDILELLEASPHPLTLTEIVERLGLPKASCFRLLGTLAARGYITQETNGRRFLPGVRLAALGARVTARMDIAQIARPRLELLATQTGEGCQLSIGTGAQAVCILRIPSPLHPEIGLAGSVGTAFPLHAVAVGKVLLAFATAEEQAAYLDRALPALTPNTHTDREQLAEELTTIRQNGFACDDEEYRAGLCAYAAPLFDSENRIRGAIALPFLKATTTAESYRLALQEAASDISAALGAGYQNRKIP